MDSKDFLLLLETPFNIDSETSKELSCLWEQFHFSQPLAYLRARCLLEQNDSNFERASRFAQAIALNRRIYNEYISGKASPLKPKPLSWKVDFGDDKTVEAKGDGDVYDTASAKAGLPQTQGITARTTKKTHDHLIQKFIQEEPRIQAPSKDTSSGNLAEKINGQTDELVTETLAQVYAQQGFVAEAIDIFEKLSAKNPEKSSYFAKKTENLKNRLKL